MKMYCFYLKINNMEECINFNAVSIENLIKKDSSYYYLYAITNNKKYYEIFSKTRNLKIFFVRINDVTRSIYKTYTDKFSDSVLNEYNICIKKIKDGIINKENFNLVCTESEYNQIHYYKNENVKSIISDIISNYTKFNKKSKLLSFNAFTNDDIKNLLIDIFMIEDIASACFVCELDDVFNYLEIDELSLFIRLFSNTFKRKNVRKSEYEIV